MLRLLLAACALLPTTAVGLEADDEPLSPASLPASTLAPSEASAPLHPTAESGAEPTEASPRLLERPNGGFLEPWLDTPHAFLQRRIFDVVYGFDRFFADERDLDYRRPNTFLRWRSEMSVADDGTLAFGTALRADVSLPYLQRRLKALRIVLEDAGRDLTTRDPAALSEQQNRGRGDAILRWTLLETVRSSIDLGGGVLFQLPPGLVGRARFRYARELGNVALGRTVATGFWNTNDGFGFKASLALERSLARRLLLRWTTGTLVSQVSSGYESASEVALLATLGRTTALTLLGSASTQSKPEPILKVWRVATRLRTALFRRWIYGEVEPQITWPLDAAGGRRPVPAVMLRLELQFEEAPPNAALTPAAAPPSVALPPSGSPATSRRELDG